MPEFNEDIRRLVKTIFDLAARSRTDWVTWNQVARLYSGSAEFAEVVSGMAALPDYRHLFATTDSRVKLTQAGIELARSDEAPPSSTMSRVADAIRRYASEIRPIVLDIASVSVVAKAGTKIVHAIFVEVSDEVLPTETPVEVQCHEGQRVRGKLVGQEPDGDVLYVSCDTDILPFQSPHKLIVDRAYLLTELADQIQALPAVPDRILEMFTHSALPLIANRDSLVVGEGLARLNSPWTRFLWGPPGAGKSFGLGHLAARLLDIDPQETVLIVAPSNRAVDVAVNHLRSRLAANSLDTLVSQRRILRFGYPRSPDVLGVPELLGPAVLDELNTRVHQLSREIKQLELKHGPTSEIAVFRAKLLAAQEAVKDAVREHVAQCAIVATTTTLAYMPRSPVAARCWDTVIVDEVTMVPPAMCAFLASRAKKRLLLAGDPCQLGPVFQEPRLTTPDMEQWLKRDVFTVAGISNGRLDANAIRLSDPRLARISSQRRCGVEIWNQIGQLYPQVANAANGSECQAIAALRPAPGSAVVLVDLSDSHARCERLRRSWRNPDSAHIAFQVAKVLASQALPGCRIAIISPYRAQVKLLRERVRDEQKADNEVFNEAIVDVGTVHQFQGSEAEAVVFDLVDGPGRSNLGMLLRGDAGTRLVNVAISRAKGKLVVLANRDWCRNDTVTVQNEILAKLVCGDVKVVSARQFMEGIVS